MSIFKSKKKTDPSREAPPENLWPNKIITLSVDNFDEFIDKYPISIVDFSAEWCGPCKAMYPIIRQLSKEYKGKVAFGKVDIEKERAIAKKYRVMGVPKFIFFSYNKKIFSMTGMRKIDTMRKKIDDLLL